MANGVEEQNVTEQTSTNDTPMESAEKLDKGKGKMAAEQDVMEEDDDESEEDEEVSFLSFAEVGLTLTMFHRLRAMVSPS
jgi:hypothetical protein